MYCGLISSPYQNVLGQSSPCIYLTQKIGCTNTIKGRIRLCTHVDDYTRASSFTADDAEKGLKTRITSITIMGLDRDLPKGMSYS